MNAASHWCEIGKHRNCAHSLGGPQEGGVWFPECYVTVPLGNRRVVAMPPWGGASYVAVVRPSHRWHCTCDCHQSGQLPMFGVGA